MSGTIDQKTYLKIFRGASAPLTPLDAPMHEASHHAWVPGPPQSESGAGMISDINNYSKVTPENIIKLKHCICIM